MKNKNMKKLVVSFGLLALAGAMAGTSTFAWFSMNKKVSATGLQLAAKSEQTLVITEHLPMSDSTSVVLDGIGSDPFIPCTYDSTSATKLKYVTDGDVSAYTGGAASGSLTFADAIDTADGGTKNFYNDYVVYIAARGDQITGSKLTVEFDDATITKFLGKVSGSTVTLPTELGLRAANVAATVDFYVEQVTTATSTAPVTLTGTHKSISLADIQAGSALPTVELWTATIPEASSDNYIRVTMRAYIDGDRPFTAAYCKADVADAGLGITGVYDADEDYFTYDPASRTFSGVDTPVNTDFSKYYVANPHVTGYKYVSTESQIDTTGIAFGFSFKCV